MTAKRCARLWQVEAARDGRLTGKDLASAVRHRETCAECTREGRAVAQLGHALAALPELEPDALNARRTRQSLMSALNEAVIAAPPPKYRALAAALAVCAVFASALLGSRFVARSRSAVLPIAPQIIDIYAAPGARWSAHTDAASASVAFEDGAASFVVHPHRGRRVVVRLPDGEVEDMGTVFELTVREQRTRRVAVSEGKVVVRLAGHPEFSLAAGEAWELAQPSVASAASANSALASPAPPPTSAKALARRSPRGATTAVSSAAAVAADSSSANAEDEAYLQIVALLQSNEAAQARREAKSYLLRFPNGFRRVEVLNIAMRGGNDAADASTAN